MNRTELEQALWTILDTLREFLGDLILVGGWVPYLHLTYGEAVTPGARMSLTADADIVVPTTLELHERRPISEALEESGFRPLDARALHLYGRGSGFGHRKCRCAGPSAHARGFHTQ